MRDEERDETPVAHIPLTSLHDAGMVATACSHALGVRESSQRSGEEALLGVLRERRERRLMLTLDNGAHGLSGRATVYEAVYEAIYEDIHAQPARVIEGLAALTPFDRLLKSGLFGA